MDVQRFVKQEGVALLFVLTIIVGLSLLMPAAYRQVAQGFNLAVLEIEQQRAELLLRSALAYGKRTLSTGAGCNQVVAELQVLLKKDQYSSKVVCNKTPKAYLLTLRFKPVSLGYYGEYIQSTTVPLK